MMGTLLNIFTVLLGGGLGAVFGARLPERVRQTVMNGLGLFTLALGLQMTLKSENMLIVLGSVLLGGIVGEWWRIDDRLNQLGAWLEAKSGSRGESGSNRFIKGFVTASLVFCVGPMTILGSIQDGLTGKFELLALKSVLDGFAALAFASSLGVGVLFSALTIGVFQGALTLLAAQAQTVLTPPVIAEMTATGGVLIMGIAFSSLLELKQIRVGNFLPALLAAPAIVLLAQAFGR
ncbi:MAG: DUF554 domain-containing protein [Chloroflexi bacterium]|nr:DUF554 domain-containing protein [Chloroflexota bacterium]